MPKKRKRRRLRKLSMESLEGRRLLASLSGSVFHDTNQNGSRDGNERGIPGVFIELTGTALGETVLRALTADDGSYAFVDLGAGSYTISETQPPAFVDGDESIGSQGGDTNNDMFEIIDLLANVEGRNNNFGESRLVGGQLSKRFFLASTNVATLYRKANANLTELAGNPEDADLIRNSGIPSVIAKETFDGLDLQCSFDFTDVNANGRLDSGEAFSITFAVTNVGSTTLTEAVITDDGFSLPLSGAGGDGAGTLAPGATETATFAGNATDADFISGMLINDPTVTGKSPSGQTITVSCSDGDFVPPILIQPSITLQQTATPVDTNGDGLNVGDRIDYQYTVRNDGNDPLTSVALTDTAGGTLTLSDNAGDGVGVLSAGAVETATSSLNPITQAIFDTGFFTNDASVVGSPSEGTNVSDNATSTETFQALDIEVTKFSQLTTDNNDNGRADQGDVITYSYTVRNTGNVELTVSLTDDVLGAVTLDDTGGDGADKLAADATDTGSMPYTVLTSDITNGSITNVVTATGTTTSGAQVTDTATDTFDLPQPDIAVTKTAEFDPATDQFDDDTNNNGRPDVDEVITYSYTVRNTGDVTLSGITVFDTVDGAVTLSDNAGDGPAVLAAGDQETGLVRHTITQTEFANSPLVNNVTAIGNPVVGDAVSNSDSASVAFTSPSIAIVKTADTANFMDNDDNGRLSAGDFVTYTYRVTNTGDTVLNNVTLDDDKIGAIPLSDAAGDGIDVIESGVTEVVTATQMITTAHVTAGELVNLATATGTPPIGNNVTNSDNETITFSTAGISIQKSLTILLDQDGDGNADLGDEIQYSYRVENTGGVTLNSVTINDDQQTNITALSSTLTAGQVQTVTADRIITAEDVLSGILTNTVVVMGTPADGGSAVSDTKMLSVNIGSPSISVTKSFEVRGNDDANGNGIPDLGDTITYTYVVTNSGDVTLSGLVLNDDVIGAITLTGTTLAAAASDTVTAAYVVKQADINFGELMNTATATGTAPGNRPVTSESTVAIDLCEAHLVNQELVLVDSTGAGAVEINGPITVGSTFNIAVRFQDLFPFKSVVPDPPVPNLDNGVVYISNTQGATIEYVVPAGANDTLSVNVTGTAVRVTVRTNASGTVLSTAAEVADAVNADEQDVVIAVVRNAGPDMVAATLQTLTAKTDVGAVLGGYVDILFDSSLVTVTGITPSTNYLSSPKGDSTTTSGEVVNAGGQLTSTAAGFLDTIASNTVLTLTLTADAPGTAAFSTRETENTTLRESVTLLDLDGAFNSRTCYRGLSVNIVAAASLEAEGLDVNGGGTVTSLDALMIINQLNRSGAEGELVLDEKYDVNGDGNVTASDALDIMYYLGDQGGSGSRTPIAMSTTSSVDGIFDIIGREDTEESVGESVDEYLGLTF